jgi:hypothetical protein
MLDQLVMVEQAPRKEKYLLMESPGSHILIEIGQIRIVVNGFVERFPSQSLGDQPGQSAFTNAYIPGYCQELLACNRHSASFIPVPYFD